MECGVTSEGQAGVNDADQIVVLDGSGEPRPENTAPEWWVAMSFEADEEEPERIGRIPPVNGPAADPAPQRATYGMLTLAAFLGVLVCAGLLTRLVS